jgi:hypothetical protein
MSPCTDTNENPDRKLTTENFDRSTHKQKKKGKKEKKKGGKTFLLLSFFRSSFFFFFLNKHANNNRLETRGLKKHCKTKTKKQNAKIKRYETKGSNEN